MKLAVKRENKVVEIYTKWLLGYLNFYAKTDTSSFDYAIYFIGTSDNETFLTRSSTSNFFTTIFEPGSTIN